MKIRTATLAGIWVIGSAAAQDWPRYLGPEGSARVDGSISTDWKSDKPDIAWRTKIGAGCGGFAIADGRAVVMGNDGRNDIVWCFDAASGKRLWNYSYPEGLDPKMYEGGPNVTPTIDGDRVYTLSRTGNLLCLSMADGKPLWRQHYQTDFKGKAPSWGYSASPVVKGDLLYCLPVAKDGGLYALDKMTGKVRWKSGDSTRPGYAAPVFFNHQGKDAVAAFHGRELVAYDIGAKGRPLFDFTWRTSYDVNASNPQYQDGKMFLASGYGMGYAVIDVSGRKPRLLHKEEDTRMIFQNSVLVDGDIVGVFGDKNIPAELIRMDMASGTVRWRERMPGTRGSSLMVGDSLIVLAENGELIGGTPARAGWREGGRIKALSGRTWAPVAYADGMVFARTNKGDAVAVKVR